MSSSGDTKIAQGITDPKNRRIVLHITFAGKSRKSSAAHVKYMPSEAWSPYSQVDRKHVLTTMSQRAYYSSPGSRLQKSLVRDCYYKK